MSANIILPPKDSKDSKDSKDENIIVFGHFVVFGVLFVLGKFE